MTELRRQRDMLIAESDWRANSDVTMSSAWKTYRQALRDMPKNNTSPSWDGVYGSTLGNVTCLRNQVKDNKWQYQVQEQLLKTIVLGL